MSLKSTLSDAGDIIFGSEGSPGTVQETAPAPFPELRPTVSGGLSDIINSGGTAYEGPFVAGLGSEEQIALDQIAAFNRDTPAGTAASQDLLQRTLAGDFLSPESNPYLSATIKAAQRPVIEAFQDSEIPALRALFTRAGKSINPDSSSPFDVAQFKAGNRALSTLGDISTRIAGQNFQSERSRQQEATKIAPAIDQQQFERLVSGLREQALPRLIEQLGIDRGLAEFKRRTDELLKALTVAGNLAGQQPETAVFQPTPGTPGALGEILNSSAAVYTAVNSPSPTPPA